MTTVSVNVCRRVLRRGFLLLGHHEQCLGSTTQCSSVIFIREKCNSTTCSNKGSSCGKDGCTFHLHHRQFRGAKTSAQTKLEDDPVTTKASTRGATPQEVADTIRKYKAGIHDIVPDTKNVRHFKHTEEITKSIEETKRVIDSSQSAQEFKAPKIDPLGKHTVEHPIGQVTLPHPIWTEEQLHDVKITHMPPKGKVEHMSYYAVQGLRKGFDLISGFNRGVRTEKKWTTRFIVLETVAGVPGMIGGMARHLESLRKMSRDHGWIHTLLEEAENERMHLMTFIQLRNAGVLMRLGIIGSQAVFVTLYGVCYMFSPRFCHKFVGYLEEEAVKTYSTCVKEIENENGPMQQWKTKPAPELAKTYWQLAPEATMHDVILNIRADEAHHRVVNHTLGGLNPDDPNPFPPGY